MTANKVLSLAVTSPEDVLAAQGVHPGGEPRLVPGAAVALGQVLGVDVLVQRRQVRAVEEELEQTGAYEACQ